MKILLLVAFLVSLPVFADCQCGMTDVACLQRECGLESNVDFQTSTGSGTVADVANQGADSVKNQKELSTYEQWQAIRYSTGITNSKGEALTYSPHEQYQEVSDKYRGAFDGQ